MKEWQSGYVLIWSGRELYFCSFKGEDRLCRFCGPMNYSWYKKCQSVCLFILSLVVGLFASYYQQVKVYTHFYSYHIIADKCERETAQFISCFRSGWSKCFRGDLNWFYPLKCQTLLKSSINNVKETKHVKTKTIPIQHILLFIEGLKAHTIQNRLL